jgi:hypothetical protein
MPTTADCAARAAAQLKEAARDVARVADLRSHQSDLHPRSAQHGCRPETDVTIATTAIRKAVIHRAPKAGLASGTEANGQSAAIPHAEPA